MLEFKDIASIPYDPIKGIGCSGERTKVRHPGGHYVHVPVEMTRDDGYALARRQAQAFDRLRSSHDFEFWCATCCHIRDKKTGRIIEFYLNNPQRYIAAMFEQDRRSGRPIRYIMLKARQWGGSTLVQMYMAWIQCTQRSNWNSLICAHVKDTSSIIRGMYSEMLADYPEAMWQGAEGSKPEFKSYERSGNTREIPGRGCRVSVGTSENQEAVRGANFAMAHLSEVAFWADTASRSPGQFIRAVCGSIDIGPMTLIVMESTANGVGNFFHSEWLRACAGRSDKKPVFIPWYYIPIYSTPVTDAEALLGQLDDYERALMSDYGCTLEQVNWYHTKRTEYPDHSMMQAEYPTNDIEAFTNTGYGVFSLEYIEKLRSGTRQPSLVGEMTGHPLTGPHSLQALKFASEPRGPLQVWREPVLAPGGSDSRYIVVVDVGGRSRTSDYSVIAVFDRLCDTGSLEVVAQWRGHCDHDILAWKAAAIARWYDNALLVYESNTLETDNTEGDPSGYILNEISLYYDNMYYRGGNDVTEASSPRPGFHTNRATKTRAITLLNAALRDCTLIERDAEACNEMTVYENKPNGSQGARQGHHDDILITRAIALTVAASLPGSDAVTEALQWSRHN